MEEAVKDTEVTEEAEEETTSPETENEPEQETEEEETEPEPPNELKFGRPKNVGNLNALQLFEYEGKVYTRRRITGTGVVCLASSGDELVTLPGNTKVKPAIEEDEDNGDD